MGVVDIRQENASHSPAGKVKQFLRNWQMITSDQWVLNCVKGYEIDWVAQPSQTQMPRELVFSKTEADCLSQEVESLVQKEAISEISMPTNEMLSEKGFVSQLFAVPKKDGGIRPVVNLKVLNSYVKQVSFKMEGIHLLKDLLCPGDWMTKVDLKDAYFAIPLNCEDRKLLRFQWQGKLYQFNCLPFGLSSAPWIFTKATKPVVTILRTLGMRIIIYIDDILVMAPSKEIAQQHTDCLIFLLENLGFTINRQKSLTDPSQEIEFLGLIADSIEMELQLPGSKIKNIRSDAKTLLQASQPTAREVSRLLGKLTHATHAMRAAPPLLQASSVMPSCRPATDAGLHSTLPSDGRGKRGIVMVGHSPNVLEWEIHPSRQSGSHNRDGRLPNWLGSPLRKPPDGRTMVPQRSSNAHQLPGASGSNSGNSNLCQEEGECPHSLEDGQHVCPDLHQQDGWYGLTRPQSAHQRTLVLVPYQECHTSSLPPPRNSQQESGRGIQDHERSIRLDALPGNLSEHSSTAWSLRNRPVCVEADKTAPDVRELATRPRGSGDRCVLNELERTESLCQPAVEHDLPGLGSSQATGGNHCFGRSGVENSSMVLPAVDIAHPRAPPDTPDRGFDTTNPPNQLPKHTAPVSRVAYLRAKFSAQRISPQASKLLLASWREKSGKTYDSLFRKWAGWCTERDIDPLSGDVTSVVNFLADLFHQGYQHRSLCSYRSAISSVHEPVDGQPIGSHPMVSRLLKGVFHERPPQPRYSTTWDVSVVTNHIESLGDNQDLTLADLTLKVVALLALTRPSRSVDLTNLDIRFRHFCPEGVTFHAAKLAKQSRQTKPVKEFFFPKFEQNKKLCPVLALQEYEKKTSEKRSSNGTLSTQLLIAMIKPHKPVSSSTVARWLKTVLNNAGIDTSIFKAHSVRSAATSSASEAGVTTATILDAADWATETVFQRFYYKPKHNTTFGHAVLSQLSTTDRRATNSR